MRLENIFIYYALSIMVLFLSYRLSLPKTLLFSIFITILIIIREIDFFTLEIFSIIAFIMLVPFINNYFKKRFNVRKDILKRSLNKLKDVYDELIKNDQYLITKNLEKEKSLENLLSLYEISKDMSGCLLFDDIFNKFTNSLRKSFKFRSSRFILFDGSFNVESIYKIEAGGSITEESINNFDKEIIGFTLKSRKILLISQHDNTELQKKLYLIKSFETICAWPILVEQALAGIFYIENLADAHYENFTILMRQFSIQFQKVMLYKKVEELSVTDSLTGVSTRRYFLQRSSEEVRRSMRHKSNMSFLMLDIDYFKKANDLYGHLVGDVVLEEVSNALKANLREIDIIGRYGGEEFAIVLSDTPKHKAYQVAERIRKSIENLVVKAYDEELSVTVSIGISVFPDEAVSIEDLIEFADKALYRAKETGRNRVC